MQFEKKLEKALKKKKGNPHEILDRLKKVAITKSVGILEKKYRNVEKELLRRLSGYIFANLDLALKSIEAFKK